MEGSARLANEVSCLGSIVRAHWESRREEDKYLIGAVGNCVTGLKLTGKGI